MSFKEKSEWQHKALKFLQIVKNVILMSSLNFQIYNKDLFFSGGYFVIFLKKKKIISILK